MKVDLLIVNYNTQKLLKRLVETLHSDYEPDVWTISIADNGSADKSVEWLENYTSDYHIDNIVLNKNIGYAKAINHLASLTNNEILCAVNADTWFTTKHVKDIIKTFTEHPNIAICGPKQLDERNHIRHAGIFWAGIKAYKPKHRGWNMYDPTDELYKDLVPCWTISGSIYYVRRNVWNEMGNHPDYQALYPGMGTMLETPMYFEETFVSQWAQKLGYEVWYDGIAETTGHTWGGSQDPHMSSKLYFKESQAMYMNACDKLGIEHEC